MPILIAVLLVPLILCVDDLLLYDPLLLPYSNHAVVDNPLALTVPFSVAELDVTFVASVVVTVGETLTVDVVKVISLPIVLPAARV